MKLPLNVSLFSVHSNHAPVFLPSAKSPSRSLLLLRSNHDHVPVFLPWSYVPWTRGIFLSRQIVNAPSSLPFVIVVLVDHEQPELPDLARVVARAVRERLFDPQRVLRADHLRAVVAIAVQLRGRPRCTPSWSHILTSPYGAPARIARCMYGLPSSYQRRSVPVPFFMSYSPSTAPVGPSCCHLPFFMPATNAPCSTIAPPG